MSTGHNYNKNIVEYYGHSEDDDRELVQDAKIHDAKDGTSFDEEIPLDDKLLNESLAWIPKPPPGSPSQRQGLTRPILIPTASPGIRSSFSRVWAPMLSFYGVLPEDFLHFIDHLNVCKAASPPLQVLGLAGTVVGFVPAVPFAWAIGLGTSGLAIGGTVAVARVRIRKYLEQANREYFVPQGLVARIVKQNQVPELTGLDPKAPLLAPLGQLPSRDPSAIPSLRDRRMQALGPSIEPIEFHDLPDKRQEGNFLDRLSAKAVAFGERKKEKKTVKEHLKYQEDEEKEREKRDGELAKIGEKERKVLRKEGNGPKAQKELRKLHEKRIDADEEYREKVGDGGDKEVKAAKKFLFICIQDIPFVEAQKHVST